MGLLAAPILLSNHACCEKLGEVEIETSRSTLSSGAARGLSGNGSIPCHVVSSFAEPGYAHKAPCPWGQAFTEQGRIWINVH